MPVLRSRQTGDMYVEVFVETPQKLTRHQREILIEFERLSAQHKPNEPAYAA
jgi:molecular chaperone DnaJ